MSLCVKCGVAGNSSAANNLCQKCFNATSTSAAKPLNHVLLEKSFRSSSCLPERRLSSAATSRDLKREASVAAVPMKSEVNRCSGCRRKVGLTGFRCRCGDLFCADHRYSDRHDCSYDYKSACRGESGCQSRGLKQRQGEIPIKSNSPYA